MKIDPDALRKRVCGVERDRGDRGAASAHPTVPRRPHDLSDVGNVGVDEDLAWVCARRERGGDDERATPRDREDSLRLDDFDELAQRDADGELRDRAFANGGLGGPRNRILEVVVRKRKGERERAERTELAAERLGLLAHARGAHRELREPGRIVEIARIGLERDDEHRARGVGRVTALRFVG